MNFQTNRIDPIQFAGDEPPHVATASVEDEQEGPGLFIYVALALWSAVMFSAGWLARSLF